jgi:hypothetical protein
MSNLLRDLFDKNYYSDMLKQWQKENKETRDCFACKRCLDMSDKYTTYHECEYGGPLPKERTCLLWEDKDA